MRRSWWDLSKDEAEAIFDHYRQAHPGYVERFVDQRSAARSGSGRDRQRLDFSYDSLRPAWAWHLEDLDVPRRRLGRGGPPTLASWVDDGPDWAAMHGPLVEALGPVAAWQVNDLAAYLFETVLSGRADAALVLDTDEGGAGYNQPVVQVAGQTILRVSQVLVLTRRAAGLDRSKRAPDPVDGLHRLVAPLADADSDGNGGSAGSSEPAVEVVSSGSAGEVIATFSDALANERSADLDTLVAHLAARPGVSGAQRTDRELVVVQTSLDPASIERMIARHLHL